MKANVMNVLESKDYLQSRLPDFTITVQESYKDTRNNRYKFEKNGIDAAVLLAQSLPIESAMLDNIADAVINKFLKSAAKQKPVSLKEPADDSNNEVKESDAKPNNLELNFYKAAKSVVEEFESKYPMT